MTKRVNWENVQYVMIIIHKIILFFFFFLKDPAPPEISTLPLHDALPICHVLVDAAVLGHAGSEAHHLAQAIDDDELAVRMARDHHVEAVAAEVHRRENLGDGAGRDRKSTRLNSSHSQISYAVFCLKKKKT